jgi:hypothetical protein
MENKKTTSERIASLAAKVLADDNSSTIAKQLAGSALAQVQKDKQTGSELEDIASQVLKSKKYSEDTRKLAASILSQSNKQR